MTPQVNELDFQRCVDGELSDIDQQALLSRLEQTPEGWRTLALAFVEQQVWGQGCRALVESSPSSAQLPARGLVPAWTRWLTMAVALAMAVGLGFAAGLQSRPGPVVADRSSGGPVGEPGPGPQRTPQPVMNLEFVGNSESSPQMTIPVFDRQDLGPDYWEEQELLPSDVRQALSQRGYDVRQQREFVSIPLDDGRQVAVPVDTVLMTYRGL